MRKVAVFGGAALAILAIYAMISLPEVYRKHTAEAFARFAEGGVSVRETGRTIAGSYDLISVPTGIGLLLSQEFELTNSNGEKRVVMLCDGHPDYLVLERALPHANPHGNRVSITYSPAAVQDEHVDENHLGFQRHLRFEEMRGR